MLQLKDRFKKGETVIVIFHDHGTRYVGKMFNPEWMRKMGYETVAGPTARELIRNKDVADVVGVMANDSIEKAVSVMRDNDFSQIPVTQNDRIVGSLSEAHAYSCIIKDPSIVGDPVQSIMLTAFPYVDIETPVTLLASMITPEHPAVLLRDFVADKTYIVTGYDVLKVI